MFGSKRLPSIMLVLLVLDEGFLFPFVASSSDAIDTGDVEQFQSTVHQKNGKSSIANIAKSNAMNFGKSDNYFQKEDLSACTRCGLINPKKTGNMIIDGTDVEPPYKYPWVVRVNVTLKDKKRCWCGGSIINAYYVLTAAHCVDRFESVSVSFLTNTSALTSGAEVQEVIQHPDYKESDLRNDIALLKLKNKIICDKFKNPICLPPSNLTVPEGTVNTVTGWGDTKPEQYSGGPTERLKEGKMQIVNYKHCVKNETGEPEPSEMEKIKYCKKGLKEKWQSTCHGDSGGAAFYERDGKYYQISIASAGVYPGCKIGDPLLHTAVPSFVSWIKEVIGRTSF